MKKLLLTLGMALTLVAQDEQPPKEGEEEELTPQKAIQILREVQSLMQKSEDLLENSSRGKDLLTDEQVMKIILKELEEMKDPNPAEIQKKVVEKLKKLMEKSSGKQKEAADKMTELVKKIQSQSGQGS